MTFLAITSLLLANTALGFAEDASNLEKQPGSSDAQIIPGDSSAGSVPGNGLENDQSDTGNLEDSSTADKTQNPEEFISRVRQELNLSKTDYKQLLGSIATTKKQLEVITEENMTLGEQLQNLDSQVALTSKKLLDVIRQVLEKESEIALLYEQIEANEVALQYQKDQLKDYIRVIYQEENAMFSISENGDIDAFKLLLTDGSVGENLRELDYFDILNEAGQQMVDKLDQLEKSLKDKQTDLEEKKVKLEKLQDELTNEKDQLQLQKQSKEQLLRITLGQEEIFKQLLEQTIAQQEQMVNDIKSLGNALNFLEAKITEEGADFDIEKYKSILDYKTQALYTFQISTLGLEGGEFMWPVEPYKGISAYFRDPTYVGTFGVRHNAVDIPQYQGSPVRAAGDGVVYVARDNGYGYSYIILAHAGG
ncbi:MAG: hypothetical protein AAB953_03645, partial [Patescibacteria group bacterium]